MAADAVVNALDSVPARLQRVEKSFSDLDSQRALLANCTTVWKELEDFFADLHTTIQSKLDELAQRQKEFTAKIQEEKLALGKRTEVLPSREKASLARVKEQKDAAIAAIMEERRNWFKDHEGNGSSEITASWRQKIGSLKSKRPTNSKSITVDRRANSSLLEEKLRRRLKSFCENMDGKQLWKFLVAYRKRIAAPSDELRCALQSSSDPVRLVLKALESYRVRQAHPEVDSEPGVVAMRHSCIFLLETLSAMIANPDSKVDHPIISSNAKDSARAFARSWRSKMDIHGEAANVSALDAQAFLQLLAIFDIASEYKEDELLKFIGIIAIAGRRQTPAICRSLGLSARMPDLVDKLVKDGKQMGALSLANSFGLMDKIQQVSLLKEFLKDVRVASHLTLKKAPSTEAGQGEAITKELSALNAVLKAVKEYKLGSQYPTDNLKKRIRQLEKAKEEKKRATMLVKLPKKRARRNVMAPAPAASMPIAASVSTTRDNLPARGPSEREHFERGQFGGAFPPYDMPMRSGYDRQPQGGIDSAYVTGTRSSPLLTGSYLYPSDERESAYGSTSAAFGSISDYSTLSGLYGGYQYAGALGAPSTYQLARPSAYHSESAHPSAYQSFTR